jgi:hypothetical protein
LRFDTALDADMLDKLEGAAAERRAARQAASVARALWRRISMTKLSTDQLAAVMVAAAPLAPEERAVFLEEVAAELAEKTDAATAT